MMSYSAVGWLLFLMHVAVWAKAQQPFGEERLIRLPDSLRTGGIREFSGMAVHGNRILLLPENRSDKFRAFTAGIYVLYMEDVLQSVRDTAYLIPRYRKYPLRGIETIMQLPGYEGLEGIAVAGERFFMTVETEEDCPNGYLVTGTIESDGFSIDTMKVLSLPRPVKPDGSQVFNAGFESLCVTGGAVMVFYEYNYFAGNYAYRADTAMTAIRRVKIDKKVPFRMTDVVTLRSGGLLAVNYFFPLEAEKAYRLGLKPEETALISNETGFRPYARLVRLKAGRKRIRVGRAIPLPERWWNTNWEALAEIEGGLLLVNDKYAGLHRESTMLFVPFSSK